MILTAISFGQYPFHHVPNIKSWRLWNKPSSSWNREAWNHSCSDLTTSALSCSKTSRLPTDTSWKTLNLKTNFLFPCLFQCSNAANNRQHHVFLVTIPYIELENSCILKLVEMIIIIWTYVSALGLSIGVKNYEYFDDDWWVSISKGVILDMHPSNQNQRN